MDEIEKIEQAEESNASEAPAADEAPKEVYIPRPAWQVWGARIALVVFIITLIMYYVNLLKG